MYFIMHGADSILVHANTCVSFPGVHNTNRRKRQRSPARPIALQQADPGERSRGYVSDTAHLVRLG